VMTRLADRQGGPWVACQYWGMTVVV